MKKTSFIEGSLTLFRISMRTNQRILSAPCRMRMKVARSRDLRDTLAGIDKGDIRGENRHYLKRRGDRVKP